MLPTGHFAAGYLTTKLAIAGLLPYFPQVNDPKFWAVGIAMSVLPDLDEFYAFYKAKSFTGVAGSDNVINHRKFPSHTPFFHLVIGALGAIVGWITGIADLLPLSILYVVGAWTHFFFDSFFYGIMWLWPLSRRHFAFRDAGVDFTLPDGPFLKFWSNFLLKYFKNYVFYLEILVIVTAVWVFYF